MIRYRGYQAIRNRHGYWLLLDANWETRESLDEMIGFIDELIG